MRCPNLVGDAKKVCLRMTEANLIVEISDFDIEHFCKGEPKNCYYYRQTTKQETTDNQTDKQEKAPSFKTPTIQKMT